MQKTTAARLLRITTTTLCLSASVTLSIFWARGHYWVEQVFAPISGSSYLVLGSMPNQFGIGISEASPTQSWATLNMPSDEWLAVVLESTDEPQAAWTGEFAVAGDGVMAPYWFGVSLFAALAAIPWIRWRFSLRTMLIVMTLVAVVLGIVASLTIRL